MTLSKTDPRYDGPKLEQKILDFWNENDVFAKTIQQSKGEQVFTFNEGPPTANGKPGIHHVLARSFKDIYPRFKTMRGFYAPRRAGWDTHGLPVEHEIEKELGIFDKEEIIKQIGISEFTRRCKDSVMRYIGEWEKMTERMGFWVDLNDAYYTLDNKYIESVWHLLKLIWDKGLIYQDYKVVPYDPRIGTTLSSHEVAQGYRETIDPAVTVRFTLIDNSASLLVWTTTPWTLPANLALAVGENIDYVLVKFRDENLIVAESRYEEIFDKSETKIIQKIKGKELVGKHYHRLFNYLDAPGDICRILSGDFVSTEDGTGIVHVAPAYGVDDLALGQANDLPVVHAVGLDGNFKKEVTPVAGKFFKDADPIIINLLEEKGSLFKKENYSHNYPFGWRTGDPLIYYAKNAWYIRTTNLKDRMVQLNNSINWVPDSIRTGRFGNWLEHNIDWALSRERFWGTPLPLWTDGEGDFICIGSLAELESLCGKNLSAVDLHRPEIDDIVFTNPENDRIYRRVPEVIDCWFDSGAMPYAQWHYPFENNNEFIQHFPADYICEAIDQTRGWFYSLHAIGALVSDSVAYRNCICLNHIVDKDGKKMSKSVGNILNPYEVFDTIGADSLRWYFLARLAPESQKRISVEIVREVASSFVNTLWNTYSFFTLYASLDNIDLDKDIPISNRQEIDRWALALLYRTVETVTHSLESYNAHRAGQAIEFLVNQLSNWYIRRNRRRFWKSESGDDKQSAYLTLYECLSTLQRLLAPFMPFIAEEMYQNLERSRNCNSDISVHMTNWPVLNDKWKDNDILFETQVIQDIVALGRSAREASQIRVRQPLAKITLLVDSNESKRAVEKHQHQILEELNIKKITFIDTNVELVSYRIKPNLPILGKKFGKQIPEIRKALGNMDSNKIASFYNNGEQISLKLETTTIVLQPEDLIIETQSAAGYSCAENSGILVALDTDLTDELVKEGLAREIVRTIQDARKQAGLDISDRIRLHVAGDLFISEVIDDFQEWIITETLTENWDENPIKGGFNVEKSVDNYRWNISLEKNIE